MAERTSGPVEGSPSGCWNQKRVQALSTPGTGSHGTLRRNRTAAAVAAGPGEDSAVGAAARARRAGVRSVPEHEADGVRRFSGHVARDGVAWRAWTVAEGRRVAFVTYNCAGGQAGLEDA